MNKNIIKQKGAVSLFIVIFAALLITVITVGFVRIMIQNQQQATANDLSQSAYDSAQAGVEDAKRAILLYESQCAGGNCDMTKINSQTCNEAVGQLTDVQPNKTDNEVKVQTSGDSGALNQAYTCVKVSMLTDDYLGKLDTDSSKLIPLVGVNDFDTVKIEWFNAKDLKGTATNIDGLSASGTPLLSKTSWNDPASPNRPSIMRAQLIQFDKTTGFSLNDFDKNGTTASNNTLSLYPSTIRDLSTFSSNIRPPAGTVGSPIKKICKDDIANGAYACTAILTLPRKVSIIDSVSDHTTYLNLKSFYKSTNYKVTLINSTLPCVNGVGSGCVKFNGVEPMIDSTGRADNLFRRVQTRVEFGTPLQPEIYVKGNFCKTFFVTDPAKDVDALTHYDPGSCTP